MHGQANIKQSEVRWQYTTSRPYLEYLAVVRKSVPIWQMSGSSLALDSAVLTDIFVFSLKPQTLSLVPRLYIQALHTGHYGFLSRSSTLITHASNSATELWQCKGVFMQK